MQDPGIYNEAWADASAAELFVSVPETWRPGEGHGGGVEIDYEEWPARHNKSGGVMSRQRERTHDDKGHHGLPVKADAGVSWRETPQA
ncbi:hypothetical protein MY1884_009311 [Beauveria asiatica]